MRSGHNPNRFQKKLLSSNNMNCNDWLLVKTINDNGTNIFKFKNKNDEEIIFIDENGTKTEVSE